MNDLTVITKELEAKSARSAWAKGLKVYQKMLLKELENAIIDKGRYPVDKKELKEWCLNGASDCGGNSWSQYSYGGCALVYDYDIAKTLCTPSELKKTNNGEKAPNCYETWLDVQARALEQAFITLSIVAFSKYL